MQGKKAMVVMDYINEIIHPDGKFAGKGYANFAEETNALSKVAEAVKKAREQGMKIIYIKVGFSPDYREQPKNSPLFGKADQFGALKLGTWATEFHDVLDVREDDAVFTKNRVSPFFGTSLDSFLRTQQITDLYLSGVSTDLVVQSAAREAHDLGYNVYVLADCCVAGSAEDHKQSLRMLAKIAKVDEYKALL